MDSIKFHRGNHHLPWSVLYVSCPETAKAEQGKVVRI